MQKLEIVQVPAFLDNYLYLIREASSGLVGVVDPGDPAPIRAALAERGWRLTHILNTHHHPDHVGGNLDLKRGFGATVVGPKADAGRIPGIDVELEDGQRWRFGEVEAEVVFVPGHTRGHIAYWFAEDKALFCGDTMFALGCGRLFEGTPEQMWASMQRLLRLPDDARVYCAHEYTQKNARFAMTLEPGNPALRARAAEIDRLRAAGVPTVPSTIGEERATNPFLRPDSPEIQETLGLAGASPVAVFAEARRRRDRF